jgi:hypothetical protein
MSKDNLAMMVPIICMFVYVVIHLTLWRSQERKH